MDTGRLSLTLCEAVVEEHSQPEEVFKFNQQLKFYPNLKPKIITQQFFSSQYKFNSGD